MLQTAHALWPRDFRSDFLSLIKQAKNHLVIEHINKYTFLMQIVKKLS